MSTSYHDNMHISERNRKLLNDIAMFTGNTTDELLCKEHKTITCDYARGYLSSFSSSASDQKILLAYFILKMLITK